MQRTDYPEQKNIIQEYVNKHYEETRALLKELAVIPAPSGQEERRAEFVLDWLHRNGAAEAYADEAGNVVYRYRCADSGNLTVIMSHMDVVCPDTAPLMLKETEGRFTAPGVRDDTANLVNMLMTVKFLLTYRPRLSKDILFVASTGEEGLGNLRGSRRIYQDYGGKIGEWICFDLNYDTLYNRAVGSRRYRVAVRTAGGHSYKDFGTDNAIALLAEMICDLYRAVLPEEPKITYNVGRIEGGTSVNTIAQEASMLYEFRSESESALRWMEQFFQETIQKYCAMGIHVETEVLGVRPGNGKIDAEKQRTLENRCLAAIAAHHSGAVSREAGSTDGNIPLSEGIPSVTLGTALGGGTHTREEWVDLESMKIGQAIALEVVLGC